MVYKIICATNKVPWFVAVLYYTFSIFLLRNIELFYYYALFEDKTHCVVLETYYSSSHQRKYKENDIFYHLKVTEILSLKGKTLTKQQTRKYQIPQSLPAFVDQVDCHCKLLFYLW